MKWQPASTLEIENLRLVIEAAVTGDKIRISTLWERSLWSFSEDFYIPGEGNAWLLTLRAPFAYVFAWNVELGNDVAFHARRKSSEAAWEIFR